MAAKGIAMVQSRFALLKVEDDDSDENNLVQKKADGKDKAQAGQGKKKNKKKKKESAENAQLRNLAFGSSGGGGPKNGAKSSKSGVVTDAQWEEWQKMDKEYTTDAYERDLEQAILLSKVEFEQKKSPDNHKADEKGDRPSGKENKKKKNKKKENKTISLDQFNQLDSVNHVRQNSETGSVTENGDIEKPLVTSIPQEEADTKFFSKVQNDAAKIIQKEKIQEQYRKHYIAESARIQHYEEEVLKKDEEISRLSKENKELSDELKSVRKRNQQLCHILSQGEMKEKSLVLEELEQLRTSQTELTQQVIDLTQDLEKERSKNHALQKEKGGKYGK